MIAYHNLAVEQEFLKMYHEAQENYQQGKYFAEVFLGPTDPVTLNMIKVCSIAKDDITIHLEKES